MSKADDLLVEVGTEELPPKALRSLMLAFGDNLTDGLNNARLPHGEVAVFASPRRLAVLVSDLAHRQDDRRVAQKGPPISIAFDDDGNATPAALAFAKKCGTSVAKLGRHDTGKGSWLSHDGVEEGRATVDLVAALINAALSALPIPRRMRWGAGKVEFVRPVHWVVLLHGKKTIPATILGVVAGNESRGHRVHSDGRITIRSPGRYLDTLEQDGHVIADFARRRQLVCDGVIAAANSAGGTVVDGESLYDEVASLVEWPVPVLGSFDDSFLELPREAVISTLTGHQRYFPLADADDRLLSKFVTIANIESRSPEQVREGNERVIRPRLADAAFFWNNDRQRSLESRSDDLHQVVYQHELGNLFEKSQRVVAVAAAAAAALDHDDANVTRAALLAKCDLVSGMVSEFPELQGTMGRYYALTDGEPGAVAQAIGEQYLPRYAGDALPQTLDGQLLALADKLDTLAGVFSLGKAPSGNRDPFGLRRAALGVVRILIEGGLDLDLLVLLGVAVDAQPNNTHESDELIGELYRFVTERLRQYFHHRDTGLEAETFAAVMARQPTSLLDFDRRLAAVQTFLRLEQAASLAAANKRIANILRKAGDLTGVAVKKKLLRENAELALSSALEEARRNIEPLLDRCRYAEVLNTLADLRDPVDRFFDDVLVMDDDDAVRNNRLALLNELRALFLNVADISQLP